MQLIHVSCRLLVYTVSFSQEQICCFLLQLQRKTTSPTVRFGSAPWWSNQAVRDLVILEIIMESIPEIIMEMIQIITCRIHRIWSVCLHLSRFWYRLRWSEKIWFCLRRTQRNHQLLTFTKLDLEAVLKLLMSLPVHPGSLWLRTGCRGSVGPLKVLLCLNHQRGAKALICKYLTFDLF